MKIAIIGAGISGLTCAYQLEQYKGIEIDIYEKNSYIGDQYNHVTAVMNIFHRPYGDLIEYLKEHLNLKIKPLHEMKKVVHHSPNNQKIVTGKLGYFFLRGRVETSLKNQLLNHLKRSNIKFNTFGDYVTLKEKYDYVIIADGDINFTKELGCYQEWISPVLIGVTVYGNFDENTLMVWFNRKYTNEGYAYLTPFNKNKAFVGLVITNVKKHEANQYLKTFLEMEDINHVLDEAFILEHRTGYVYPHALNNIYFVGSAAGGIDPFLGFGQLNSFITGAKAAKAIALHKNYENLIRSQINLNINLFEYRYLFNKAYNNNYNELINIITTPGIKHLLYNSSFDFVKYSGKLLRFKRNLFQHMKFK
ncbi:NAD(P)/FAD-dependent oxidoreductase [Clostridiaceae bacterium M8S5]|nr:NAD(P)/FAD-dependent oxidoreductase [Clostridiaceae bacterium M8S5]